jgi:hypothetical protein
METSTDVARYRIITAWFDTHFQRTDGKFSKRHKAEYNKNCVVVNAETLWQHFRYCLHLNAADWMPSKPFFFQVLRWYNVKLKHVKNRYVGSIKLAALVRPALGNIYTATDKWHPSGSHATPPVMAGC